MLRRALCFVVALLMLGDAARAAVPVVAHEVTALVDDGGADLLPGVEYDAVFQVDAAGTLFAVGEKGEYHLYDSAGKCVSEQPFAMIRETGNAFIFRYKGLYGAMDASGEVVVEPLWTQLVCDGAEGFLGLTGSPLDDQPDAIYHIVPGEEAVECGVSTANGLSDVRDNRMSYMLSDGRCGYLNGRGEVAVAATWRYAGPFSDGLAVVSDGVCQGLIDTSGAVVLEPVYTWIDRADGIIAALEDGTRLDVFDDGAVLRFSVEAEDMSAALVGSYVCVMNADGAALYDIDGTILCEASASASFAMGLNDQVIVADGNWGEDCQWLVNADGSVASGRFQRILPLCASRYSFLTMNGVEYYSNDLGALQKSWDYGSVRYGLMDDAGNILLDADYREIRAIGEDRLLLLTDEVVILADENGNPLRRWITAEAEVPSGEAGA